MARSAVVIGGGIAGLTTAYRLSTARPAIDVTLLEAGPRLGGKIKTTPFAGVPIDEGADAFLTRVPWAIELCRELGLDDSFIAPATGSAFIVTKGKLRPIPDKTVLGVPTSLRSLAKSGVVSPLGMARAGLDLIRPDNWPGHDESVAELIARRLGPEIAERLVDPLVSGIMASDTQNLSAQIVTPQLAEATRKNRSLIRALREQRKLAAAATPGAPVFYSFEGGVGVLVERLARAIPDVDVRMSTSATQLEQTSDGYAVHAGAETFGADIVVIATPANAVAPLLREHAADAAAELASIEYASVALVTVAFSSKSVRHSTEGSGFLVPRGEGMLMTACSWGHRKWPHWTGSDEDKLIFRISTGRFGDERALHLDDDELVESLLDELGPLLDIHGPVLEWRVSRWPKSFPQYPPGHGSTVSRIEADVARSLPGVNLAGASYRGVGIPACIRSANEAAARAIDHLSTLPA